MPKPLSSRSIYKPSIFIPILAVSILINILYAWNSYATSIVIRVVDGDSFELSDHRRIRLLGVNTPEKNRCMYNEAKQRLEELTINRHVRLKDTVTDSYGRILANVIVDQPLHEWLSYLHNRFIKKTPGYLPTAYVNRVMIEEGLGSFTYVSSQYRDILKQSSDIAQTNKHGIYSSICTKKVPQNPNCTIKGNIRHGTKTYLSPGCRNYNQTEINTAFGDTWFCTEEEAIHEGFAKSGTYR